MEISVVECPAAYGLELRAPMLQLPIQKLHLDIMIGYNVPKWYPAIFPVSHTPAMLGGGLGHMKRSLASAEANSPRQSSH